jgi:hypothetical protein
MGADLYIELAWQPNYFRDGYGDAMLWRFGLSWWNDVIPMLDDQENYLSVEQAQKLLELLRSSEDVFEKNVAGDPEDTQRYFRRRYAELRRFLETAIRLNTPVLCSL